MINDQAAGHSGLRLERFSPSNAELVLKWRNAQHVRAKSLNDELIKLEDHLRFVDGLKGREDRNFFIVHIQGTPVAELNVNVNAGVRSWGCYLGGGALCGLEFSRFLLGWLVLSAFDALFIQELQSDVLESNTSPQTMNDYLGIPITDSRVEVRPSGQELPIVCYALKKNIWPTVQPKINAVLTKQPRFWLANFSKNPEMLTSE